MSQDRVLITGGLVLPDAETEPLHADILVEGDDILAIEARGSFDPNAGRPVDASDQMIIPGLVNGHTHGHGALSKGQVGDRVPLEVFLTEAGGFSGNRTLDDKRLTAELTAVELVRRGCTTTLDMFGEYPVPSPLGMGAVADAYETVGMRAVIAPMMADRTLYQAIPGLLASLPEPHRETAQAMATAPSSQILAGLEDVLKSWRHDRQRIRPGIAPTIPLHCSDDFMSGCAKLAEDYDTLLQTHLAETRMQNIKGLERYGRSLVAHLEGLGLLSERLSAAHGIWLSEEDMSRLGAHGCGVVHNPMSNLRLGSGVAQARKLKDAGVVLGIGTDATNTSDGQNMFEALRLAAYLSRISDPDPARWLEAREAFEAATVGSARILGFEKIGRLSPGWAADMVFIDLTHITYVPLRAPLRQMAFAESGAAIRSVMIAGRMVLEEGRMTTIDEAALRKRAEATAARLDAANAETIKGADAMARLVGCFCLAHAKHECDVVRTVHG
ncbi:MAG: amidohydrolase family protein [Pseudomonadota bacterium]